MACDHLATIAASLLRMQGVNTGESQKLTIQANVARGVYRSAEKLSAAVAKVGVIAKDIEAELKRR